jgi:riboflavin transporter FmnP
MIFQVYVWPATPFMKVELVTLPVRVIWKPVYPVALNIGVAENETVL